MSRPDAARRSASPCGCGPRARGTCPHAIACPWCQAAPGARCLRPSGHPAGAMHAERYRASERADAVRCPGFEPLATSVGTGCRHCSGLPEDHAAVSAESMPANQPTTPAQASAAVQGTLF